LATKLIWLALRKTTADWGRLANTWKVTVNQFAILHEAQLEIIAPNTRT